MERKEQQARVLRAFYQLQGEYFDKVNYFGVIARNYYEAGWSVRVTIIRQDAASDAWSIFNDDPEEDLSEAIEEIKEFIK